MISKLCKRALTQNIVLQLKATHVGITVARVELVEVFLDVVSLRETVVMLFRYFLFGGKIRTNKALAVHPLLHAWAKGHILEAGFSIKVERCAACCIPTTVITLFYSGSHGPATTDSRRVGACFSLCQL